MSTLSKASLPALRARLSNVLREIEKVQPSHFAEMQFLRQLIDTQESVPQRYSGLTAPRDIVLLCLAESQRWMSKDDLFSAVTSGGFVVKSKGLFNDAVGYLIERGTVVGLDGGSTWEHVVGMPHWEVPEEHRQKKKL